ncbi:MAG: endonuclease [Acholeplasma sp.]|jgi:hypothetical protein|nr:endonuclease [Acholeplasma sp.]
MLSSISLKNITNIIFKEKRFLLFALLFSTLLMVFGVLFLDNRWWWILVIIIPLSYALLHLYKTEINYPSVKSETIKYALNWSTFFMLIFVLLLAIFVTAWWWFGLLIVISMLGMIGSFGLDLEYHYISKQNQKKILIMVSSVFLMLTLLFFIPSLVANFNQNPKDSFSSQWHPVTSYSIYGSGQTNTEHVIARSWYTTDQNYVNDYVNIIWSLQQANSARANLKFGRVLKVEKNKIYYDGELIGYKNDDYFMPIDEYKGDVARILLYMYVTYKDDGLNRKYINVGLMKTWSKSDPVDEREKLRNETIEQMYGYKNRFVSTPWLIGFIV